jgi:hypothetical protein
MDPVAVTLVFTFIVMLATGAMTMHVQRPPFHRRQVACPEDQQQATVALSWKTSQQRMVVAECDHRNWKDGRCQHSCAASLQTAFPELLPTVVLP